MLSRNSRTVILERTSGLRCRHGELRRFDDGSSTRPDRSRLAIGQLPSRYAMALDARDLDALVALFVEDVDAGAEGPWPGRLEALVRRRATTVLPKHSPHLWSQFDFVDADHATGSIYCRAEHEDGDGWFVITMRYDDLYESRDGRWCFVRRREYPWYSVDVTERLARSSCAGLLTFRCGRPCRSGCPPGGPSGMTVIRRYPLGFRRVPIVGTLPFSLSVN